MFEALWAMFDAARGLKKSPGISSSELGNSFKWVSYSWLIPFLVDLCHALLLVWGFLKCIGDSGTWCKSCRARLRRKGSGLTLIVLSVWQKSLLPPLCGSHHWENKNQQIHEHFGKCCLYSTFLFCKRRTMPSTSHGTVGTKAVISIRCFGNPLWEAQSKFNAWPIIIPLIMFGNMLG